MDLYERFKSNVQINASGCWIWTGTVAKNGRPSFAVAGRPHVAARVAYDLFKKEIPHGLHVCHSCDVAECVNPDHLWVGTHDDNMADAARKGRMNRGEANAHSKLTEEQVREIYTLYATGNFSQHELARRFDVGHSIVFGIISGTRWVYLGLPRILKRRSSGLLGELNPARRYPERLARGEKHPRCKFSDDVVAEFRRRLPNATSVRRLAHELGISETHAQRLAKNETRKPA